MGARQNVKLLRDENDPKHKRMAAAIEALLRAEIYDLPMELEDYFGITDPGEYREGETGLEVRPPEGCVKEYRAEMEDGFDIYLDKLPPGVKKIRAYTSY